MRPVNKGKKEKKYAPYSTARHDLYDAIGRYCSYCERRLIFSGAIEHVRPKSIDPDKEHCWDNFLLACVNCNSCKNNKPVDDTNIANYLWPDKDDTYHNIEYDSMTGMPKGVPGSASQDKADALLKLVGLDKAEANVGTQEYEKCSDTRVSDRLECIQLANKYLNDYRSATSSQQQIMLPCIIDIIKHTGFWSIWMHAFECEPTLKDMMLNLLPGTEKKYFA